MKSLLQSHWQRDGTGVLRGIAHVLPAQQAGRTQCNFTVAWCSDGMHQCTAAAHATAGTGVKPCSQIAGPSTGLCIFKGGHATPCNVHLTVKKMCKHDGMMFTGFTINQRPVHVPCSPIIVFPFNRDTFTQSFHITDTFTSMFTVFAI